MRKSLFLTPERNLNGVSNLSVAFTSPRVLSNNAETEKLIEQTQQILLSVVSSAKQKDAQIQDLEVEKFRELHAYQEALEKSQTDLSATVREAYQSRLRCTLIEREKGELERACHSIKIALIEKVDILAESMKAMEMLLEQMRHECLNAKRTPAPSVLPASHEKDLVVLPFQF